MEANRGAVFGMQASIRQLISTASDLSLVLLPGSERFGWLIVGSYAFVLVGTACYLYYYCVMARRKRLGDGWEEMEDGKVDGTRADCNE